jgi:aminopeptidase YwaD
MKPALLLAVTTQGLFCLCAALTSCSHELSDATLRDLSRHAEKIGPVPLRAEHLGPPVAFGPDGTARFARKILVAFDPKRALEMTAFADRFYREPANDGYEAVIDALKQSLEDCGFGKSERLLLEVIETPLKQPAWTPKSARLELIVPGESDRTLHAFAQPEDKDRTMLPHGAPSAHVEGRVVTSLAALESGCVLLTEGGLQKDVLERAKERGAVLVLAADVADYCIDPIKGGERHLDAIGYRGAPSPAILPVAQISPRSAKLVRDALAKHVDARLRFDCAVELADRPLRTIVATVVGAKKPGDCAVIAAHVQEPGACDNASGVGAMLEAARTIAKMLDTGELEQPLRSLCFVWGLEMGQSRVFLDHVKRRAIAGISADMLGESEAQTGAIALLERSPDPGAMTVLPPDKHTPWGQASVSERDIKPNGLPVIARCALLDVGAISEWKTSEHPYEGGSDHDVFLGRGIPAVLFWHFTDFAYHTSLDRMENVDAEELRRTGTAVATTALAIADARPGDLDRYLRSLRLELELRLAACDQAHDEETAKRWREWSKGARLWIRNLCLDLPDGTKAPAGDAESDKP